MPVRSSIHILIVDDDPSVTVFLSAALTDSGYSVDATPSAAAALALVANRAPDLILTDLEMPRMNGLQLFAAIRAAGHRMPVVLMSAGTNAGAQAIAYGMDAYLAKPFQMGALFALVERLTSIDSTIDSPPATESGANRPKVAVINASNDLARLLVVVLENAGFAVVMASPAEAEGPSESIATFLRRENPKVVVYDVSLPYPEKWLALRALQQAEGATGSGRQFVITTPNKRALDEHIGSTEAIELSGDLVDRTSIVAAVARAAAAAPDLCC